MLNINITLKKINNNRAGPISPALRSSNLARNSLGLQVMSQKALEASKLGWLSLKFSWAGLSQSVKARRPIWQVTWSHPWSTSAYQPTRLAQRAL